MLLTYPLAKALCGMWRVAAERGEITECDVELRRQVEDAFPSLKRIRVQDAYNQWLFKEASKVVDATVKRHSLGPQVGQATNCKWWEAVAEVKAGLYHSSRSRFEAEHLGLEMPSEDVVDQPALPAVVLEAISGEMYESGGEHTELREAMEGLGYLWDESQDRFLMTNQPQPRPRRSYWEEYCA